MADNIKTSGAPPQVAEGEIFLFVRLNHKTGEFQCLFSNFFDALALHSLAETHLAQIKAANMGAAAPLAKAPGFQLPSLDAILRTNKQS